MNIRTNIKRNYREIRFIICYERNICVLMCIIFKVLKHDDIETDVAANSAFRDYVILVFTDSLNMETADGSRMMI